MASRLRSSFSVHRLRVERDRAVAKDIDRSAAAAPRSSHAAPPTCGTDRSTVRSISVNCVLTMKKMIRLKTMSIIGVRLIAGRSSWCVFRACEEDFWHSEA